MNDLRDLRVKVTPESDCAIRAHSRVTGKDVSEVVRDVVHEWAVLRIRENQVLTELLKAEGLPLDRRVRNNGRRSEGT